MSSVFLFFILLLVVAFGVTLALFLTLRSQQSEITRRFQEEMQKTTEAARQASQEHQAQIASLNHQNQANVAQMNQQFQGEVAKLNQQYQAKYDAFVKQNQTHVSDEMRKNQTQWQEWAKTQQERLNQNALTQFNTWKTNELEAQKKALLESADQAARNSLAKWRMENEATIRQDAITRSHSVILGKVSEHVAPFMPVFPYNPRDARFIGSPIDIVIFDGADEGTVRQVIFMEIKSGTSSLTSKQRGIREAILEQRVVWQELKV